MSHFSNPKKTEGTEQQVVVSDEDIASLLERILQELKMMNIQLSIITDNEVTKKELR